LIKYKILYIGFSNLGEFSDSRSTPAGIAQSIYTESVLRECATFRALRVSDNRRAPRDDSFLYVPVGWWGNLRASVRLLRDLLLNTDRSEVVVLYHSFLWIFLVPLLRLFGFKVVLQVNEIFYNAGTHVKFVHKFLELMMFRLANAYIVSCKATVPFIRASGSRSPILSEIPGPLPQPFLNNPGSLGEKIRLVYAGVVDTVKNNGAFMALELATKLNDSRFEIDIFGFGDSHSVALLSEKIKIIETESRTKVTFKGSLTPSELTKQLTSYDVGLAIQDFDASFGASSFPSKILHYLSSGLTVIATGTPAVVSWDSKDMIFVYFKKNLEDLVSYLKCYDKKLDPGVSKAFELDSLIKKGMKEGFNDFICRIS